MLCESDACFRLFQGIALILMRAIVVRFPILPHRPLKDFALSWEFPLWNMTVGRLLSVTQHPYQVNFLPLMSSAGVHSYWRRWSFKASIDSHHLFWLVGENKCRYRAQKTVTHVSHNQAPGIIFLLQLWMGYLNIHHQQWTPRLRLSVWASSLNMTTCVSCSNNTQQKRLLTHESFRLYWKHLGVYFMTPLVKRK